MSSVYLEPALWHPTPTAELLREWVREELPRRVGGLFDRILLMAGGKADYLETKVKNEVLGAVAFGAPATVYFALWTTAAGTNMDAYNGATAGEVSGGAYDRVAATNNTTNFPTVADNVSKKNGVDLTFATATANWNAGAAIPQMGVFDGNLKTSADNLLLWSDLTTARIVLSGDTAKFAANDFTWQED